MRLQEFKNRFNPQRLTPLAVNYLTTIPFMTANDRTSLGRYRIELRRWLINFQTYLQRLSGNKNALKNGLDILTVCHEIFQETIQTHGIRPSSFESLNFDLLFTLTNANIAQLDKREQAWASRAAATSGTSTTITQNTALAIESCSTTNQPTTTVVQNTPAEVSNLGMLSVFRRSGGNKIAHEPLNLAIEFILAKGTDASQADVIQNLCNSRLKFINQLIAANTDSWDTIVAFLNMLPPAARIEFLASLPDNSVEPRPILANYPTDYEHCLEGTETNNRVVYTAKILTQILNRYGYYEASAQYSVDVLEGTINLSRCKLVEEVVLRHMSLQGLITRTNNAHEWEGAMDTAVAYKPALVRALSEQFSSCSLLQDYAERAQRFVASTQVSSTTAETSRRETQRLSVTRSATSLLNPIPHLIISEEPYTQQDFLNNLQQYQTKLAQWLDRFNTYLDSIITNVQALNFALKVLNECYHAFLIANGHYNLAMSDVGTWSSEIDRFNSLFMRIEWTITELNPDHYLSSLMITADEPISAPGNAPLDQRYLKVLTQDTDFSQKDTIHHLCQTRFPIISRLIATSKNSWETMVAFLNQIPAAVRIKFLVELPEDMASLANLGDVPIEHYDHCPVVTEEYKLVILAARLLARFLNRCQYYESCAQYSISFEGEKDIDLNRCPLVEEVVVQHMSVPGLRTNLRRLGQLANNAREWGDDPGTVVDYKPAFMRNIAKKLRQYADLKQELENAHQALQVASTSTLFKGSHVGVKRSAPSHRDPSADRDPKGQYTGL